MNLPANQLTALQAVPEVNPTTCCAGQRLDSRPSRWVLMNWPSEIAVACKSGLSPLVVAGLSSPTQALLGAYPLGPALTHRQRVPPACITEPPTVVPALQRPGHIPSRW